MTVAEIGCGRCLRFSGLRVLTRNGHRSRKHGIPSAGNEQESALESPRIRLLFTRHQVGPGMANPKQLDGDVYDHTSATLRMSLPRSAISGRAFGTCRPISYPMIWSRGVWTLQCSSLFSARCTQMNGLMPSRTFTGLALPHIDTPSRV